jgi:signal transduction histidine kinase
MSKEIVGLLVIFISVIVILAFVLFLVYVVSIHQKSRNKFLLEMEEMKNNFKSELLQSQLEMQEQTFEAIAMEIHDNVSQMLSVSKLNLDMIEDAPPEVIEKIQYSVGLMSHAMNDLKDLSRRLDSDLIRKEGLGIAIENYIIQLKKSVVKDIVFNVKGFSDILPVEKELILFRILQEATNNIVKHAEASFVQIDLAISDQDLSMDIRDNGKGFDFSEVVHRLDEGSGLKNMQKRCAMIQGTLTIDSEPGKGTRLNIHIPIPEEKALYNSQSL